MGLPPGRHREVKNKGSRRGARLALKLLSPHFGAKSIPVRNLKQMAFFPKLGLTLNRLQKNGSSTAVGFLYFLENGDQVEPNYAKEQTTHLSELGIAGVAKLLSTKKLVIVRDPYSRLLSAFLNKFRTRHYQQAFGPFD